MSHSDKEKVVLYRTGKKMHRQDCLKRCLSLWIPVLRRNDIQWEKETVRWGFWIRSRLKKQKKLHRRQDRCWQISKVKLIKCYDIERVEQTKEETDNGSEHLHEMLYTLSEKYRKVIVLYYMEEMTTKEIANILRISESTVRKRLQRGRDMLRQKGEGQWER